MRDSERMKCEPYQVFFPIGFGYALWGATLWLLFAYGQISHPGALHAQIMIGGFLFSFAVGFLMTAVPQFLGAQETSLVELILALFLVVGMGASSLLDRGIAVRAVLGALTVIFLAVFFARRFRNRQSDPPAQFLFIPLGLLVGAVGGTLLALSDFGIVGPESYRVGRLFLFEGTMLCLTFGVGGRLVTALLGWLDQPLVQIGGVRQSRSKLRIFRLPVFWQALGFLVGLLVETFGFPVPGRILRAIVATWVAFKIWKLHRRPEDRTTLTWGIWISCWFLVSGVWATTLFPSSQVHGLHLLFIGGFGLMSILIATRVSFAHGDHDFELLEKSWPLRVTIGLIAIAAVTRASAPFSNSYVDHLKYAAASWVIANVVWIAFFLSKIFWPSNSPRLE